MKLARIFGLTLGIAVAACSACAAETVAKTRVLVVGGFSDHDWQKTTALIRPVIEPTGLFDVSVSTASPTAAATGWDAWRPKFSDFDVAIQNGNDIGESPQWPAEVRGAFEDFVRRGGGVFIFQSGNNAFPTWPAHDEIIGPGRRKKEQGFALSIDDNEQIVRIAPGEGRDTGRGPRGDVVVTRLGEHPIHAGFPRRWETPGPEVYYYARGPAKNIEVLAYA